MNCGCGSTYTLTPGDRLYLSAMVKSLQQRVSALEGGGIGDDLAEFIDSRVGANVPAWALEPAPPVETDPTVPAWAKQSTKPTYGVAEISGAASETYVDAQVDAHANRTDNPHNVTAAQLGVPLSSALSPVAFSGDYTDLSNRPTIPTPVPQVNADWAAVSGVAEILNKPVLGSAAAANVSAFATAAQGAKADTALQPADVAAMAHVADAPNDGSEYVRKNNTWSVSSGGAPGGGGLKLAVADLTFYVRSDGNDSNNGGANTAGSAFLTVQRAINEIYTYDLQGYSATVFIGANGTYTGNIVCSGYVGGQIRITGDATKLGYIKLSAASGVLLSATRGANVQIDTIQIEGGASLGAHMSCSFGAVLTVCPDSTHQLLIGATGTYGVNMDAIAGGVISLGGGVIAWYAGSYIGLRASRGGVIQNYDAGLRLYCNAAGVAFSGAFVGVSYCGSVYLSQVTVGGSQSATGPRYAVNMNGCLGVRSGVTLMGNVAGTAATGGQVTAI